MNTRRAVKGRALRRALGEMFDFEWTSRALFSNSTCARAATEQRIRRQQRPGGQNGCTCRRTANSYRRS